MSTTHSDQPGPIVPATLDGWSLLHQGFRIRWPALHKLSAAARAELAAGAAPAFAAPAGGGGSALVQLLGHKGDLLIVHARADFDALAQAQLDLARAPLFEYLEPTLSYVSIVELGMYDMTGKLHDQIGQKHKPGSEEFERAFDG